MNYDIFLRTIAVLTITAFAPAAHAQSEYPTRPIQILVGFTAGSASDLTARFIADGMNKVLRQRIVVLNRPGAGATIAATEAARAANDGYTLFLTSSAIAASVAFRSDLKFSMKKDFSAITPINNVPLILVVSPSLGVKNIKELVALAKAKPDELTYGSPGIGTGTHLGAELFALRTGLKIRQVSYKGTPEAIADVIAGRVSFIISPAPTVIGHVQSGRLLALASAGAKRAGVMPDLPTMTEQGVPDFDVSTWFGLVAPAGTPKPIVNKLAKAANDALRSGEVKDGFKKLGFDPIGGSPEEFDKFIDRELVKWADAAKAAGLVKK
jgi:tripartite-type tricarboxylate transporter receptor subunit TctC